MQGYVVGEHAGIMLEIMLELMLLFFLYVSSMYQGSDWITLLLLPVWFEQK